LLVFGHPFAERRLFRSTRTTEVRVVGEVLNSGRIRRFEDLPLESTTRRDGTDQDLDSSNLAKHRRKAGEVFRVGGKLADSR